MSSSSALISPIDVAICDPDVLWRVDHLNTVKGVTVREFESAADALDVVTPGHPVVIVIGPQAPADVLEAVAASGPRAWWLRVIVVERIGQADSPASMEELQFDKVLPFRSEGPEFAAAVLDVLAKIEEPDGRPAARFDRVRGGEPEVVIAAETTASSSERASTTAAPALERSSPTSELIIVTAAKGGEGASTIALNLAVEFASPSRRVALVDGDPHFGDLAIDLGLEPALARIADGVGDPDAGIEELISEDHSGVLLMQLPSRAGSTGPRDRVGEREALADVVALGQERTDMVVVDVPIDVLLETDQFDDATRILVVASAHVASVKNALLAAERLGTRDNVALVINELDRHPGDTAPAEIAAAVGLPLAGVLPYDRTLVRAASEPGARLIAERRSRYRKAIRSLRPGQTETISRTETSGRPGGHAGAAALYEHVIVPFDGTPAARGATMIGADLARLMHAELVVMTANGLDREESIRHVKERSMAMSDASVTIWEEPEVNEAKAIASMISFRPNSLICMSTSARTGVRRLTYGSLAERLIRDLDVPLVLVGPRWSGGSVADLNHLMVCVDDTPRAEAAVALAAAWASALPLTATLVHVQTDDDEAPVDLDHLAEPLEEWCSIIEKVVVRNPDVVDGIVQVVEGSLKPLVVMATSARSGVDRMLHGSVMAALMAKCVAPVLVWRAQAPAPRGE
jgi:MinD-like ATPase involved in chromosome partitioning or flagellar assembly/nucleotide-binding universal stress UspA family protein